MPDKYLLDLVKSVNSSCLAVPQSCRKLNECPSTLYTFIYITCLFIFPFHREDKAKYNNLMKVTRQPVLRARHIRTAFLTQTTLIRLIDVCSVIMQGSPLPRARGHSGWFDFVWHLHIMQREQRTFTITTEQLYEWAILCKGHDFSRVTTYL